MKQSLHLVAILSAAVLAGCASPAHQCELGEGPSAAKCASVQDAYLASKGASRDGRGEVSVFDKRAANTSAQNTMPVVGAVPSPFPAGGAGGMPVFEQPRVFRPWLAPYVDAEGNLRSGEYGYFSTPGRWNYGTLRQPGNASMSGPAKPDNLGFNPVVTKPNQAKPVPAAAADAKAQQSAPQTGATQRPAEQKVGDITQPYTRITD